MTLQHGPAPGDRIGDWVVEARLGSGGMGTVFRCHNALTTRIRAAVKILRPEESAEMFRERFAREVEALEQLEHPAIVRVKGWGESEYGLWLAMDLVDGSDLAGRLEKGPLDVDHATAVFRDLAAGLAHAHARDVVHRDIKPANILLLSEDTPEGHGSHPAAKLVDFGIAVQGGRTRLSAAGMVSGTPAYLAPEVFGGRPDSRKLDLYALGQVLYEALTGEPAFATPDTLTTTARIAHVAGAKLQGRPLDPGAVRADLPESLCRLVQWATHPDPHQRLSDMDAFVAALDGEVLDTAPPLQSAATTLSFDLEDAGGDEVAEEPEAPAVRASPVEPVPIQPVPIDPSPASPTRRGVGLALVAIVGISVGLAIAALLSGVFTGPPEPARVVLSGIDATAPRLVRINGATAQPDEPQGLAYTVPFTTQSLEDVVPVEVVAGPHCDLDAFTGTCGVCCACESETARSGRTTVVPISIPTGRRPIAIQVDTTGADQIQVAADGRPLRADADRQYSTALLPGPHTVSLQVGERSLSESIDVTCSPEPLAVRLALPDAPVVPQPATPPPQTLAGQRIRLLHRREHLELMKLAVRRLRARGAQVEVLRKDNASPRLFGQIVFWNDGKSDTAAHIQSLLADKTYAEPFRASTGDAPTDIDFAVWILGPR